MEYVEWRNETNGLISVTKIQSIRGDPDARNILATLHNLHETQITILSRF